jgi:hydroxymethylglutaryl-CoA lyase
LKGYQRARECGITHIGIVIASTDTFNKRNINMTLAQATEVCQQIILQAKKDDVHVRTYISGACACPYDGKTRVDVPQGLAEKMLLAGSDEVSIADTTGAGNPQQISDILSPLIQQFGADKFNLHLHDTRGQALAMAWAGITEGVRNFDSSIGGLGGCPFAPGASGNLATEDLVYLLHESGFETGINLQALRQSVSIAEKITGQQLGGRVLQWMRSQESRTTTKPCITP